MSITFATAVYFVIWWTVLFVVLPFAGRSQQEAGSVVPGTPASAPAKPKVLRIVVATTLIAAIILALAIAAIDYNLFDLRGPQAAP